LEIDERLELRKQIEKGFRDGTQDYEELVQVASSLIEQFCLASSETRLQYLKAGVEFPLRVQGQTRRKKRKASSISKADQTGQ
jgi:hypothetical protein